MVFEKVQSLLESSGSPFTLHTHPAVSTIEDAEEKVPHLTRNLLKTIVFKIKDGDWILAVVKGHDRIDYKELARAFNGEPAKDLYRITGQCGRAAGV